MHAQNTETATCRVLVVTTGRDGDLKRCRFLGRDVDIETVGCDGDYERAKALVAERAALVDAIGLDGWPLHLLHRGSVGHAAG